MDRPSAVGAPDEPRGPAAREGRRSNRQTSKLRAAPPALVAETQGTAWVPATRGPAPHEDASAFSSALAAPDTTTTVLPWVALGWQQALRLALGLHAMGNRSRWLKELWPVPRSSMDSRTPRPLRSRSVAMATSTSFMTTLSVTSRHRAEASSPVSASTPATTSTSGLELAARDVDRHHERRSLGGEGRGR